jgi:hypothetical protein
MFLTASDAGPGGFSGAFGIGITTADAFGIGVTAVPTPLTERDWDGWLFWHAWNLKTVTATIADGVNAVGAFQRIEVDTKAMRKQDENMLIYGCMEGTEVGNAVLNWNFDSRLLVLLP